MALSFLMFALGFYLFIFSADNGGLFAVSGCFLYLWYGKYFLAGIR